MNATVREWVEKAEGDLTTAQRELRARKKPNYDASCFHSQQCIEKLMKAVLIQRREVPPKTHDLAYLGELVARACPRWTSPAETLRFLSRAAVIFRYPGEFAGRKEAAEAFGAARTLRGQLRFLLGLGQ